MLAQIHPKLPSRNLNLTYDYYIHKLGFREVNRYPDYLIVSKDNVEIHFFPFSDLNPKENYGQVYIRCQGIETWYRELMDRGVEIHPHAPLATKPWGQKEFSLLDPDNNCLTFGEPWAN